MPSTQRTLIAALVIVNLVLVGLLLFRDRSVAPAAAGTAPAIDLARASRVEPAPDWAELGAERVVTALAETAPAVEATAAAEAQPPALPAATAPAEPEPRPAPTPSASNRAATGKSSGKKKSSTASTTRTARTTGTGRATAGQPSSRSQPSRAPAPRLAQAERTPAPAPEVTLAAGTTIPVELDVTLHSRRLAAGDRFEASLARDLVAGGWTLARTGAPVVGKVVEAVEAGRVKGREQLRLTLSQLELDGRSYPVRASVTTFTADDSKKRDAKLIGGGAAVGALIGGIAGGGKGAATGAAIGGAAGTGTVLATRGEPVVLEAGSRLDFTLAQAVAVRLRPARR
jgi:hypothetical protein